ncbi:uncharacterized protein LAESUDRAFT_720715 [Laetiporus sulphureus 93-53]|uniref:Uncharacterized protein n=1 Tax=Laetiporus sulphureus 93-53 TaxID=1314785 RepID=A0A165HAM9_9APHY|nr:uncharacterized protein LAESUDRAFT_720715 [Laetiporus sulphureus 93-53]KZT11473.1 hypothetical protein LAESUDRAFT_720715 [Laetiporus sulphureus 93-53]
MFDFMRRKRESREMNKAADQTKEVEKGRSKYTARRDSLINASKVDLFTKKARHFSLPPMAKNIQRAQSEDEHLAIRPKYTRARSSSCSAVSSLNIRNPFNRHTGNSAMSDSQIALVNPALVAGPPPECMRYVVSQYPVIVSPEGRSAEIVYPEATADQLEHESAVLNPFTDSAAPEPPIEDTHESQRSLERTNSQSATPSRRSSGRSSRASLRRPVDYLQVKIPPSVLSPPLSAAHREIWTRI